MRHFARQLPWILVACAVVAPVGAREPKWPVPRGPAALAPLFAYRPEVLRAAPPEFLNDAAACFVYSGTIHTFEPDGTLSTLGHEVIRLNTRRAIDQFGEYRSITYEPTYEQATLHEACVHKANGEIVQVGPQHVHVRDVNTDHEVYDQSKQIIISFPKLEVGDVIEARWTIRGRHPEYQEQFFFRYTFGDERHPVVRDDWTVRVPKTKPLHYAAINGDVPVRTSEDGDWRVYAWTVTNRPAPFHVPRETPTPALDEDRLEVACSTYRNWEAVAEWERKLLADRCDCSAAGKNLVAELTKGLTDPTEKARVLAQWVRHNIRYVSRGEKHDYTPHAPCQVLGDRCGDCKDSAHLLALLMREAGLSAGVATLGPRGDGQVIESVPSPWGTHALTVVTIGGQDHWVDPTSLNLGWDVLPHDDCDRLCFITSPAGIRLARTPASTPAAQRTESTTTLTVSTSGNAKGSRETRYYGLAAWQKRDELVDASSAERRYAISQSLQEEFPRAKLTKLAIEGLNDFDSPLVVRAEFTVPELFAGDEELEAHLGDYSLWGPMLSATVNPERRTAFHIGDPFESVSRVVVQLPPRLRLAALGESHEGASRWGRFSVKVRQAPDRLGRIEIESRAELREGRVAPADFEAWHDFQDALQAAFRTPIMVRPIDEPTR